MFKACFCCVVINLLLKWIVVKSSFCLVGYVVGEWFYWLLLMVRFINWTWKLSYTCVTEAKANTHLNMCNSCSLASYSIHLCCCEQWATHFNKYLVSFSFLPSNLYHEWMAHFTINTDSSCDSFNKYLRSSLSM